MEPVPGRKRIEVQDHVWLVSCLLHQLAEALEAVVSFLGPFSPRWAGNRAQRDSIVVTMDSKCLGRTLLKNWDSKVWGGGMHWTARVL